MDFLLSFKEALLQKRHYKKSKKFSCISNGSLVMFEVSSGLNTYKDFLDFKNCSIQIKGNNRPNFFYVEKNGRLRKFGSMNSFLYKDQW